MCCVLVREGGGVHETARRQNRQTGRKLGTASSRGLTLVSASFMVGVGLYCRKASLLYREVPIHMYISGVMFRF